MAAEQQHINAVLTCDESGTIITANIDCELLFNQPRSQIIGAILSEKIQLESVVNIQQHFAAVYDAAQMNAHGKAIIAKNIGNNQAIELLAWLIDDDNNKKKQTKHTYLCHLKVIPSNSENTQTNWSKNSLIEIIDDLQKNSISDRGAHYVFGRGLDALLEYTQSEYGFIGEILHNADEEPYLQTHAITNIAWNDETRSFFDTNAPSGFAFFNNNTLFGQTVTKGEVVIANAPKEHPKSGGLPEGHPPLNHYLGLPIRCNNELVGMIGISNRPNGYTQEIVDDLYFLMNFLGFLIKSYQNDRERKFIASKLQIQSKQLNEANDLLRAVYESSRDIQFVLASDGVIIKYEVHDDNDLYLPPDEFIGKKMHEVLPIRVAEQFKNAFDEVISSNSLVSFDYMLTMPSGDCTYNARVVLLEDKKIVVTARDITAEKEKEFALIQATEATIEMNKELIFQKHAMDEHAIVSVADIAGDIIYVNDKFCVISGYSREELLRNNHKIVKSDEHSDEFFVDIWNTISSGRAWHGDIKNTSKTGSDYWLKTTIVPTLNEEGKPFQYVGIFTDITDRKKAEDEVKLSTDNFERVFNLSAYMVCIASTEGYLLKVSPAFTETLGYSEKELLDKPFVDFVHPSDKQSTLDNLAHLGKGAPIIRYPNRYICKDGSTKWLEWTARTFDSGGNIYAVAYDVTSRKNAEAELERIAHYDLLTNLPNRVLLADRLSQAMVQCQRRNRSLAVAFMDLDGFKVVNDRHGHNVGDDLLVEVAQRMKKALREGDTLARIGGDEFIAVMVDLENIEDSEPVLKRLLKAAAAPVTLGDAVMQVSASIGVSLYPQDHVDAHLLIRHADQAMYVAKQAGKNRYQFFDTAQDNAIKTLGQSIGDISSALGRREFLLHYQPKVNMHTGEVIGAEALIRWQHPARGLVPPLEFLPTIDGHAVSLELGEWVIDTALSQINHWRNIGVNLSISVNISAYQLQQRNFSTRLASLLAAHPEVPPHCLELEILETSVLSDISQVFDTMSACHDLGVCFALDDFGTGYSSLTHIKRLPAYLIKIDQSFVRDMLEDVDDLAIVESVIGLAKTFKREVIAEGVETIEHGVALLKLGCELAQGYGIARPMTASDIPEWVSNWKTDDSWQTYKG
jgi:diguanylate cyclase (GGDEF)-like protein/PAS domain S-box-containing protein